MSSVRPTRGLLVALLGPDGAGKTTLGSLLTQDPTLHARYFYMGRNVTARTATLPAPAWLVRQRPGSAGPAKPLLRSLVKLLSFTHQLAERWLGYAAARLHQRRGGVVLFDRYIHDPAERTEQRSLAVRLRRWLLHAGAPRPDLVVVLDAPAELLYARKREHSPERLERMRAAYRDLANRLPNAVLLDAGEDVGTVCIQLRSLILARLEHPVRAPIAVTG